MLTSPRSKLWLLVLLLFLSGQGTFRVCALDGLWLLGRLCVPKAVHELDMQRLDKGMMGMEVCCRYRLRITGWQIPGCSGPFPVTVLNLNPPWSFPSMRWS